MYSRPQLIKKESKGLPFNYLSLFLNIFFTLFVFYFTQLLFYLFSCHLIFKCYFNYLTIYINIERIYIRNKLLININQTFSLKRRGMFLLLFVTLVFLELNQEFL